jgi:hypothetical protein
MAAREVGLLAFSILFPKYLESGALKKLKYIAFI